MPKRHLTTVVNSCFVRALRLYVSVAANSSHAGCGSRFRQGQITMPSDLTLNPEWLEDASGLFLVRPGLSIQNPLGP